jgi:hypothetical protein
MSMNKEEVEIRMLLEKLGILDPYDHMSDGEFVAALKIAISERLEAIESLERDNRLFNKLIESEEEKQKFLTSFKQELEVIMATYTKLTGKTLDDFLEEKESLRKFYM